ncbi:M13 family metallopeptidase [Mycoplasmopsis caviae]|uniref:M13 family metallopeptidase n=1 Tax=Mycoplasmopsis caviae TaxID=55603 RepID=A0A3P8LIN6_9BACT|nr:M13 family metallopeptidase [Mycoplasmopsis caviae]UUD34711.1 M13 family metallopeptidase [Mycoplasmopsis caviae]VDR42412.1 Neutral endopeptidase [Mycoplasmopsis caviae]
MKKINIKDDLYFAVNQKWLDKAKIPGDKSATGAFLEIHNRNERILRKMANDLVKTRDAGELEVGAILNFSNLYSMASDFKYRNSLKVEPLKPYLDKIWEMKSWDDLIKNYEFYQLRKFHLPFDFDVMQDFKNAELQTLGFSGPSLILPEKSYYDDKHPAKAKLLEAFKNMSRKLLVSYHKDKKLIEDIIAKTLEFDNSLVQYTMSAVEMADYPSLYNPFSIEEISQCSSIFDIKEIAQKLVKQEVDEKVVVIYPKFMKALNEIYNAKTFESFKCWMYLRNLIKFSHLLDNKTRVISGEFARATSGIDKATNPAKSAFYLAYSYFKIPFGLKFALENFGPEAKRNVEYMVQKMIRIYQERLSTNNWLSQETKDKAIVKLNSLGVHVGYPSELRPFYELMVITPYKHGGNLVVNTLNLNAVESEFNFSQYKQPINKNYWGMSPAEVNAYYNPFMNHIVFPAGILAKPFYSLDQSSSANYGGIGAVIAHEISHAFDNNGAKFDEKGNLNSWWSEEDFKKFSELSKDMIDLFDNQDSEFGKCNGKLTVSENIADAGGIRCALEASMKEKDHSSNAFFTNWATVWRAKQKPEYAKMLLAADVHAPKDLRANIQAKNLDEFQNAFKIKKGDKMYLAPEKRVKIW